MSRRTGHLAALAGFVFATLILTYPIPLQLDRAVKDLGDPLLNSWILAWEVHSLRNLGEENFFDTNIFYPLRNTLAYSELLLPQLVLAAPVILLTANPILAHNVVLLASFIATAMGAYLLAMYVTKHRGASFTAGLVLAFCPFMFSHLSHVQVLFAGGIPLAFLFLHRFLDSGQTRHAILFAVVYAIQVLANAYYAVYLSFFAGLYLLVSAVQRKRYKELRFWLQLSLVGVIAVCLVAPFYSHYLQLKREMGFSRGMSKPIPVSTFLATPESNRLYGEITAPLGRSEAELFPGLVVTSLAIIALWSRIRWPRWKSEPGEERQSRRQPNLRSFRIVEWLILIFTAALILLALGVELKTELGPIQLRATSLRNPTLLLVVLLATRFGMRRRWPLSCRSLFPRFDRPAFPTLLLLAVVLTLGTKPYEFLYEWVPGFDSLRAVPRIHVITMVALAVLAAEGMAIVCRRLSGIGRKLVAVAVPLMIGLEYLSAPVPVVAAPIGDQIPHVYQWLADLEDDPVIAAFPFNLPLERHRLYYSTVHWRRTVNGYSGFMPLVYRELAARSPGFPSKPMLEDLQALGVDLILVETKRYAPKDRRRLRRLLRQQTQLQKVGNFDGVLVYRPQAVPAARDSERRDQQPKASEGSTSTPLDPSLLRIRASYNQHLTGRVLDGDPGTRWDVPMRPGEWLEVDIREVRELSELVLDISRFPNDYPRGYRIEASRDGDHWRTIGEVSGLRLPIKAFLRPTALGVSIDLQATRARFLRIVQTGHHPIYLWSVGELEVLTGTP